MFVRMGVVTVLVCAPCQVVRTIVMHRALSMLQAHLGEKQKYSVWPYCCCLQTGTVLFNKP